MERANQIAEDLRRRYPGHELLTADEIAAYVRVSAETVARRLKHLELRLGTSPRRYRLVEVAQALVEPEPAAERQGGAS